MTKTTLIKYGVLALVSIVFMVGLFMIVPTAIEANNVYQMTKEIERTDQLIEQNSQKRLELEDYKTKLQQENKQLREKKTTLQRKLLGEEEVINDTEVVFQ